MGVAGQRAMGFAMADYQKALCKVEMATKAVKGAAAQPPFVSRSSRGAADHPKGSVEHILLYPTA